MKERIFKVCKLKDSIKWGMLSIVGKRNLFESMGGGGRGGLEVSSPTWLRAWYPYGTTVTADAIR